MSVLSGYNDYFSKPRHRKVYLTVNTSPSTTFLANEYLVQESISLAE